MWNIFTYDSGDIYLPENCCNNARYLVSTTQTSEISEQQPWVGDRLEATASTVTKFFAHRSQI
jgi:hypothetical protein